MASIFAGGKYLCRGGEARVCYFGQTYHFTVESISSCIPDTQSYAIDTSDLDISLSERISNLSLSTLSGADTSLLDTGGGDSCGVLSSNVSSTPKRQSDKGAANLHDSLSLHELDASNSSELVKTPNTGISRNNSSLTERSDRSSSDLGKGFCTPQIQRTKSIQTHDLFFEINSRTEVIIKEVGNDVISADVGIHSTVRYDDFGGLDKQIEMLREMIELPLKSPDLFKSYGLPLPRGVLIFGPSGTGKTTLAKAVAVEAAINVVNVAGPEIWSKFYGETEAKLRNLFKDAEAKSPSIIVIDEIEALCPRRDTTHSELEKRVVASLLTLMDGVEVAASNKLVLVLGITSKPDLIDPALRRPGRFDREIEIGVPSAIDRRHILTKVMSRINHNLDENDICKIADAAHGYVGADLVALCKEASLHSMKSMSCSNSNNLSAACMTVDDLRYAMTVIQPSAMREVQLEVPKVLWSDIGGQSEVKLKLKQAVEWPLKHPDAFLRMGIAPPRGVLLYGPPGCSKTMIAKALATESGLNFIAVKVSCIYVDRLIYLKPFVVQ